MQLIMVVSWFTEKQEEAALPSSPMVGVAAVMTSELTLVSFFPFLEGLHMFIALLHSVLLSLFPLVWYFCWYNPISILTF